MKPFGLPRRLRVRSRLDYQRVFDHGHCCRDGVVVAYVHPSPTGESRMGTSVSKRGRTGVQRNRLRRMLREAFRLERAGLPSAQDWILSVAHHATGVELEPARASLARIGRRIDTRNRAAAERRDPPSTGPSAPAP